MTIGGINQPESLVDLQSQTASRCCISLLLKHTVDERDPAPPGMYETLEIMGQTTDQLVQDFFHQQYESRFGSFCQTSKGRNSRKHIIASAHLSYHQKESSSPKTIFRCYVLYSFIIQDMSISPIPISKLKGL